MVQDCIDLKKVFGRKYRIDVEESYYAETGNDKRVGVDPWLWTIPCRYGHLYPWGGDRLAASVDGFTKVAGRMRKLDGVRIEQDGDFGELTVSFPMGYLKQVAKVIRPRTKRQMTPEQLAHLAKIRPDRPQNRSSQLTDERSAP